MPELPEVETIRRGLQNRIVGKKITDLSFDWPKGFVGDKNNIIGHNVLGVERRAKVLRVRLSGDKSLLFHLKMTGQLIYRSEGGSRKSEGDVPSTFNPQPSDQFAGGHPDHDWHAKLPNSNTRITFTFGDDSKLFFNDMRKFGWCRVYDNKVLDDLLANEYGPEPIRLPVRQAQGRSGQAETREEFSAEYLMLRASKIPNRKIKQFLLDQTIVAGIGNIYADESLFDAKISPTRKVKDIQLSEWKQIVESVRKILELGIKHGGTTDSDYVNADGEKGGMQDYLKVYRKTGRLCPGNCGGVVERITLGGRGTHFCPRCQQ